MKKTLEELRAELVAAQQAKTAFEDSHPGRLTKDEAAAYKKLMDDVDEAAEAVALKERSDKQAATAAAASGGTGTRLPAEPKSNEKPFKSFGEQLAAIAVAGKMNDLTGASDRRLVFGKAAGANDADLDVFAAKQPQAVQDAGEKAARTWMSTLKQPRS